MTSRVPSTAVVAVKAKLMQATCSVVGATTPATDKSNKMGGGRRVTQHGTLQKGAERAAKSSNRCEALVAMELDVSDDQTTWTNSLGLASRDLADINKS